MSPADLATWRHGHARTVEEHLGRHFAHAFPETFAERLAYPLGGGGKRIRPLLCIAACEALGGRAQDALAPAVAVELVHTYSLVHDDLPCMDDDAERRGRPTVHVEYDEATAVLVGDALLTEAFDVLAGSDLAAEARIQMVATLARAAGYAGMIGGQVLDIGMAGTVADEDTLSLLHDLKTGALITAAVVMGGYAAGADEAQLDALTAYGAAVGRAFQLADDVLDADEDAGEDGPPSFVKLLGLEATRTEAAALASTAEAAVAELPSPSMLVQLARFTVHRDH